MLPASVLYRKILLRRGSLREIVSKQINLIANYENAIDSLLDSHEFNLMAFGSLVASKTKCWNGKKVFFLHIPKTAGTSFSEVLYSMYPIPPIQAYGRVGTVDRHELKNYSFWPVLSGHADVEDFPESHRGITIFRDTKSRILSKYRQRQSFHSCHFTRPERKESRLANKDFARKHTFSDWLNKNITQPNSLIVLHKFIPREYLDNHIKRGFNQWHAPEIKSQILRSLDRFDACAWCYNSADMISALKVLLNTDVICNPLSFPRNNTYQSKKHDKVLRNIQYLGKQDLECLEQARLAESILYQLAHDKLGLPLLDKHKEEDEFNKTMKRLGFRYA